MMLLLQAATQAAAAAAEGAGEAAEQEPSLHTGSWLHPLYATHVLNPHVIPEEVLVSLVMIVLVALACFLLTRRLSLQKPTKTQAALELVVGALNNMVSGLIGPEGPRHLPMIG